MTAADIPQISALIRNTLLVSNARDYPLETIRALMSTFSSDAVRALAQRREMFVCLDQNRLCGVVGLEEGEVFTFFVPPDRQGHGVGRANAAADRQQGVRIDGAHRNCSAQVG